VVVLRCEKRVIAKSESEATKQSSLLFRLRLDCFVRPEDIQSNNTIDSSEIKQARITYGGRSQITDIQQPRYGQQVMKALLPFWFYFNQLPHLIANLGAMKGSNVVSVSSPGGARGCFGMISKKPRPLLYSAWREIRVAPNRTFADRILRHSCGAGCGGRGGTTPFTPA
jgi:hypothetical protein